MLGIDRQAARVTWTVFLVGLAVFALYLVRDTLLLVIFAVLFAYLLAPVVQLVERLISGKRVPSGLSLAIVYVLFVGVLALFTVILGGRIVDQVTSLANSLPETIKNVQATLQKPGPAWFEPIRRFLQERLAEHLPTLGNEAVPILKEVGARLLAFASNLFPVVLVPILAFFFLKDGRDIKEAALGQLHEDRRPLVADILDDMDHLLGRFIRALVILAIATLAVYSVMFSILGLPYSLLISFVAALLEFIPVIGPLAAAVLIVLTAALSGAGHIIIILIFLGLYRLFQDYVLSPHLMSSGVEVHPLAVILGVLAGEKLAGVPGMFLSIPAMAILRMLYLRMRKARLQPDIR